MMNDKYYDKWIDRSAPKATLHRITVNFLRHAVGNYDDEIANLFGKTGKQQAYLLLKNRILEKIAQCYPFLQEECQRQSHGISSKM